MWRTISSKEIFNHPRLIVIEDKILLPDGHKINYLRFKDDGSCAVTIIAKRDEKILVQREYSYPPDQKLFQFPGGAVTADETPEAGANRELAEEMSYHANTLDLLGNYLIDNRRSRMKMYVYLATDLVAKSLDPDPSENIEGFWLSEEKIENMIKKGKIINVHTLASWCLYKNQK